MAVTVGDLERLYFLLSFVSLPVLGAVILFELHAYEKPRLGTRGYNEGDGWLNLKLGGLDILVRFFMAGFVFVAFAWAYSHRQFELPITAWWSWVLLFFAEDLTFYIFHRCNHRVGILWASHVNHHSGTHFNFSTAFRQTPTPFLTYIFWLPLSWLGFHPLAVAVMATINQLFQFFLHTELVGRLGFLDSVLNTPSNHRVHHGRNPEYTDKNFGGWLVLWDRIFGTYQAETPNNKPDYGLHVNLVNPTVWEATFHEWRHLFSGVRQSKSIPEAFRWLFGPPR